ncbi:MAG: ATP-binding protein [Clostridium sp.]|nr:ATP-binding protein [Clostridium sp.]
MNTSSDKLERNYTIEDLEQILDNIKYEVYLKDADGRYKYVNKTAAEKAGVKKEDIIGKLDRDFRSEEMTKICTEGDKLVLERGRETFIQDKIEKDNLETEYELFKTILIDSRTKEKNICGIAKFVTNDRSVSDYIIENCGHIMNDSNLISSDIVHNEILSKVKETTQSEAVGLYFYDFQSRTMNLNIHLGIESQLFLNRYMITDEIRDKYFDNNDCIIVEDLENDGVKFIYLLKYSNKLLGCVQIYYKNRPQDIKEEFVRYVCLVLSFMQNKKLLTDNLNNELKMRGESQKKLQMMIDSAIDYYAVAKKEGDKTVWIETSKGFKEVIGWSVDELNLIDYIELIDRKDKVRVKSILSKSHRKNCKLSFDLLCKDGKWRTVDAILNYLSDGFYMITAKDITLFTELKRDKEELEHIIELESLKTEFFANLSHEFKTPINIILTTIQVIRNFMITNQRYPDYDKFYRYITSIKQNSFRLLKLANNMIDITKIDGGFYEINIGNFNIVEVIENIVQSVAGYMKDNKRNIVFDTTEEEIVTACDPNQIERIILNILSNAMKFTSPNGNIEVNIDVSGDYRWVIIKIRNDGVPLNGEDSKKIFERFTQSEQLLTRRSEGSGIGLSLVKSLVEMHEGKIYANTKVQKGTEFCIELPIRKVMNSDPNDTWEKNLNSKVEKFDIEFSDIYN